MEKILCLPHQLVFVSLDAVDVPVSIVLWDSNGTDVIVDGSVVFSGTIAGADAAQSAIFWISEGWSGSLNSVVGGLLSVMPSATGQGIAINFTGADIGGTNSRGLDTALATASATGLPDSPLKLAPGESIVFGRERAVTPAGGVGGASSSGGSGDSYDVAGASGTQAVSTTVMRVLGATNWSGATANGASKRIVQVTNCSASEPAYLKSIANATSLTGAVSSTDHDFKVAAGSVVPILVLPGQDLAVVRTSGSDNVRAKEFLAA